MLALTRQRPGRSRHHFRVFPIPASLLAPSKSGARIQARDDASESLDTFSQEAFLNAECCRETSPDAATRDEHEEDGTCQAFLEPLKDKFLLSIRDGSWRKVPDLAEWLAPRAKAEIAVHRFRASGGTRDKKPADKAGRGRALVRKDIIDSLRRKDLLAVRTIEEGEEEVQVTPLTDPRFEIDPELESLLPRAADEVKKLEERLPPNQRGCRLARPICISSRKRIAIASQWIP